MHVNEQVAYLTGFFKGRSRQSVKIELLDYHRVIAVCLDGEFVWKFPHSTHVETMTNEIEMHGKQSKYFARKPKQLAEAMTLQEDKEDNARS